MTPPSSWPEMAPPAVERHPTSRRVFDRELNDEFAWLRAANWRDVLRDPAALPASIRTVLEAQNAYATHYLDPLDALTTQVLSEMRGRIKEDDESVPLEDGGWLYYTRYRTGGQRPIFCRRHEGGEEQVLLDGDAEAEGLAFFTVGDVGSTPDHEQIAWSCDRQGSELFEIRVRDLQTNEDAADLVRETDGSIVWAADGRAFFYVAVDENHRTFRVMCHRLGEGADRIVLEEKDPAWFVGIDRTISRKYLVIHLSGHDSTECHLVDLEEPEAPPRLVAPRAPGFRYSITHRGETLFIRTNADGAEDFKIVVAPARDPRRSNWRDLVPHRRGALLLALSPFPHHLVWLVREDGLPRLVVARLSGECDLGDTHDIAFEEEAYALTLESRLMFEASHVRFTYASMTTPRETFDYDLETRTRVLRKRQAIPSGHEPSAYVTRRLFAEASDGEKVPISLVHRADLVMDGRAPTLLYGYGAYGHAIPAAFSGNALSLVDRGFVYAIAHVRGGTDKGWHWYVDGKLENKPNTFGDFIAAARCLVAAGYTGDGLIVAHGASAGGMLMGSVANIAPRLFAGIIAGVPFVDVLNTILDPDLPLTPPEWLEWGNPIEDPRAFARIASYSPYDNVATQAYPPIFALAGLTDPRVTYWEPAKWIARLQSRATGGPFLLKTNMGAGHGGASGRFDRLAETAQSYAFAIACAAKAGARLNSR